MHCPEFFLHQEAASMAESCLGRCQFWYKLFLEGTISSTVHICRCFFSFLQSLMLLFQFRSQLQLLGAVCLLVSLKVRAHKIISAQKIIEFTDYNVTLEDLLVSQSFYFGLFLHLNVLRSTRSPLASLAAYKKYPNT